MCSNCRWPQLGSDAAWVPLLKERGVSVAPLQPSNCGFDVNWSEHLCHRFAGHPLKNVALSHTDSAGIFLHRKGDLMIIDFSVILFGYRSDFTDTHVVGQEPSADQRRLFELCKAAMSAGERELRAENPCF